MFFCLFIVTFIKFICSSSLLHFDHALLRLRYLFTYKKIKICAILIIDECVSPTAVRASMHACMHEYERMQWMFIKLITVNKHLENDVMLWYDCYLNFIIRSYAHSTMALLVLLYLIVKLDLTAIHLTASSNCSRRIHCHSELVHHHHHHYTKSNHIFRLKATLHTQREDASQSIFIEHETSQKPL